MKSIGLLHAVVYMDGEHYITSPIPCMGGFDLIGGCSHKSGIVMAKSSLDQITMLESLFQHENALWKKWVDDYPEENKCFDRELFSKMKWYLYKWNSDELEAATEFVAKKFIKIAEDYKAFRPNDELQFNLLFAQQTLDDFYSKPSMPDGHDGSLRWIHQIYKDESRDKAQPAIENAVVFTRSIATRDY